MGFLLKEPCLVNQFYRNSQGLVSDTWNLRYHEFKAIEIMLPSLEEQRCIAEILDEVDAQIGHAKRQREKLMVAAAADAAHVLREISADPGVKWTALDQLAEISAGVTLGGEEPETDAVSLPYLRVANVQDGFIDTTDIKYVTVRNGEIERYRLQVGDVLLTEGGDLDKLGRGGVWGGTIDPCLHQNHVFKVRCDSTKVLPQFLAEYLASPSGKRYFLGVAKQTTNLASINSTQVKCAPIPLVPLEGQRRVLASLEEWTQRISVADRDIQKMSALRKGLAKRLLNAAGSACTS
ncbi:restriction endonuclease subunit S [Streptomyces sp. Je 1-4]|uniref:restriction endonuclease subunit S n=1 Tax=Streptomyces TaxID=1883 RepID=UPI0021DA16CA|nr:MULTISPECIES: restriction endonuclease subunit S [unclassified Streptomyces]UYB40148.1 restriction endonuclease subunit S [Streptomyces sp. Je 1-4]UZQ36239.1 restriction endonuclease subunit S [Streptomyces sp. Je 1-4] [Streptomyces sp. Je 1-4 4N24]UZQ43657.1 restriction endonuclease subunit S [Streptomyces sp. Je 1-4] [Streptomyces sp. Je 1-4 4N24_ara]